MNLITPFVPDQALSNPATPPVPPEFFTFQPPSYFASYCLPPDAILVGDCHLTRGDLTVIGGVAGCGKSRLLMSLAIAGKQGHGAEWMGLPVHAPFKTAILQAENGEVRLQRELQDITQQGHDLDGWLFLTPPPRYGLAFNSPDFRAQLRDWVAETAPGVLAIDPWNRCAMDDKAKDYRAVLDALFEILPEGPDKPAIVVVHHLRKQGGGESRKRGRDLLSELSGSYMIGSSSRVAFILEPATPAGDDDRVIFTCAKNNNGDMGAPTAWHRRNGLFDPCRDFDWGDWESEGVAKRRTIELEDLRAVFEGDARMIKKDLVKALEQRTGFSSSALYKVLQTGSPLAAHLTESGGYFTLNR
ncbi:MAG: AAA family ATPase [Prosthecobacter sp.]|nr:AAA family ATPase [Prosthecobacter sp.]